MSDTLTRLRELLERATPTRTPKSHAIPLDDGLWIEAEARAVLFAEAARALPALLAVADAAELVIKGRERLDFRPTLSVSRTDAYASYHAAQDKLDAALAALDEVGNG